MKIEDILEAVLSNLLADLVLLLLGGLIVRGLYGWWSNKLAIRRPSRPRKMLIDAMSPYGLPPDLLPGELLSRQAHALMTQMPGMSCSLHAEEISEGVWRAEIKTNDRVIVADGATPSEALSHLLHDHFSLASRLRAKRQAAWGILRGRTASKIREVRDGILDRL